ncbi:U4/U6 small nuclear ribonucleoprotein PRP3, partial [Tremellales sp. Uapishka_1]
MDPAIAARIAVAKARIEALNAKKSNPYLSGTGSMPKSEPAPSGPPPPSMSSVNLHPLLMAEPTEKNEKKALRDRFKPMAPKFTSVKANANFAAANPAPPVLAPIVNPYASNPNAAASRAPEEERANTRKSRKMQFSSAGKYVKQGDALRNEAMMDALRARIAEASKKAGLDSEFEVLERSLKRQPPPEVEWWDKALLPEDGGYDDIDGAIDWITTSQDSLVTHLVQHPIQLAAPGDKKQPERGLMLTKKEQKKMRRQRRQAELEDKRDRQKMGLIPLDPPKVRMANLMKVLTADAVQDPTKVEARVRREVAQRAHKHVMDNEERKLTPEERKEKEYRSVQYREKQGGVLAAVFKIKYLTNGRHIFKVRETAKHDFLSGVCVFHADFALVLVEGISKKMKHYKQLMLHRIDWTEEARPLGAEADGDAGSGEEAAAQPAKQEGPESLAENKCELIWEGEVPERAYKGFRARHAETDTGAKEWLTTKYEGMWDLAKRYQWSGDDL